MIHCLPWFIALPFMGLVVTLFIPEKKENTLSLIALWAVGLTLVESLGFLFYWLFNNCPTLNLKEVVLFKSEEYEFLIDLFFDQITAVYLLVGSLLAFLVITYSRYYLHRERGYKRFFATILFFYLGYNLTVISGNFETLFIGWEILGICSFLLIAFYRDRYLPVKNAIKVYSVYRIGDVGLILAMWGSHHLWHENITFVKLTQAPWVQAHLSTHGYLGFFVSLMIVLAAAVKSAQLPFSSWLPRAMEGPTPSSAIFYSSLSVHLGVFLILRTHPFWINLHSIRIIVVVLGLVTAAVASSIARVQSSVKSQIAYASIAQIGLIFIEGALGFDTLALFHFAGNAFFRTYQLLISPSMVSYKIREQFYNFVPTSMAVQKTAPRKWEYSLYLLSLKEWNLDSLMNYLIWKPLKKLGRLLDFLTIRQLIWFFIPAFLFGLTYLFITGNKPDFAHSIAPALCGSIGLLMILKSFSERKKPLMSWILLVMNHAWVVLAISFNEKFDSSESYWYLSGVLIAGLIGFWVILAMQKKEKSLDLNRFQGYAHEYPKLAFIFLLACLGLAGFPITPTFIGLDLIFSHIHENQYVLVFTTAWGYVLAGISLMRLYARLFLGPYRASHEIAYTSS